MKAVDTTDPTLRKAVVCRYCSKHLGDCTNMRLYIGTVALIRPVLLTCTHCGNRQGWRPVILKT